MNIKTKKIFFIKKGFFSKICFDVIERKWSHDLSHEMLREFAAERGNEKVGEIGLGKEREGGEFSN